MASMNLGELLHELKHNLLHDRSDQIAGNASDYLWSDKTLVRYINQAHRRFARRSLCIRDNKTPEVTDIKTVEGLNELQLHPSIIAVLGVRMHGDHQDLARAGHDAFSNYHTPDPLFFDASQLERETPGKALAYSTDESILTSPEGTFESINLRLFPRIVVPYVGIRGKLRVIREPILDFECDVWDQFPEIPAAHHLDMLDWAAYLALRSVDTDVAGAGAAQRAADFAARFEAHCTDGRKDVMRKIFTPLQWGFGHGGWSWETF
jgi:hypothetical protein